MAYGGRYAMGTGWRAGIQTRTQFGITYKYSSYLPQGAGSAGYRGRGYRAMARGTLPAAPSIGSPSRPTRVNIKGGRSR
jgi:hypothetical protein